MDKTFILPQTRCCVALILVILLALDSSLLPLTRAAGIPQGISLLATSPAPVQLHGVRVNAEHPFRIDFLLDDSSSPLPPAALKIETTRLAKYFLTAFTVPEQELWVNLSPFEQDRIIPEKLGQTIMGRDMLEQDQVLKDETSLALSPNHPVGRIFWHRFYAASSNEGEPADLPVNVFHKAWIMLDKVRLHENGQRGVFLIDVHLKVLLKSEPRAREDSKIPSARQDARDARAENIMRETLLPYLEDKVNHAPQFARLRQICSSLVLATWYKRKLKAALLTRVYADRNRIHGIDSKNTRPPERIWESYVSAFRKGAYSFINEDADPLTGDIVPRKYASGGLTLRVPAPDQAELADIPNRSYRVAIVDLSQDASERPPLKDAFPMPPRFKKYKEIMEAYNTSDPIRLQTLLEQLVTDSSTPRPTQDIIYQEVIPLLREYIRRYGEDDLIKESKTMRDAKLATLRQARPNKAPATQMVEVTPATITALTTLLQHSINSPTHSEMQVSTFLFYVQKRIAELRELFQKIHSSETPLSNYDLLRDAMETWKVRGTTLRQMRTKHLESLIGTMNESGAPPTIEQFAETLLFDKEDIALLRAYWRIDARAYYSFPNRLLEELRNEPVPVWKLPKETANHLTVETVTSRMQRLQEALAPISRNALLETVHHSLLEITFYSNEKAEEEEQRSFNSRFGDTEIIKKNIPTLSWKTFDDMITDISNQTMLPPTTVQRMLKQRNIGRSLFTSLQHPPEQLKINGIIPVFFLNSQNPFVRTSLLKEKRILKIIADKLSHFETFIPHKGFSHTTERITNHILYVRHIPNEGYFIVAFFPKGKSKLTDGDNKISKELSDDLEEKNNMKNDQLKAISAPIMIDKAAAPGGIDLNPSTVDLTPTESSGGGTEIDPTSLPTLTESELFLSYGLTPIVRAITAPVITPAAFLQEFPR